MSKQLTLISLLIVLLSACTQQGTQASEDVQRTQPAPANTVESEPTLSISAAWTELALTRDALVRATVTGTDTAVATATAAFSICPGAPGPYATVGKQAIVVSKDVDKLKLRLEPSLSPDAVIGELNQFTRLTIVGGPVCVRAGEASYWFWQVEVLPGRESGWVAEGDVQHSFITVSIGGQNLPFTATAYTATTPLACRFPRGPMGDGVEVIVITGDSDKLKLRSEPRISPDTVLGELEQSTRLEIVGGPMCVTADETGIGYWLWKVKVISTGKTGWVAEGDGQNYFLDPLLPP